MVEIFGYKSLVIANRTNLIRNLISFYHQAYRAAVWDSRHNFLDASAK